MSNETRDRIARAIDPVAFETWGRVRPDSLYSDVQRDRQRLANDAADRVLAILAAPVVETPVYLSRDEMHELSSGSLIEDADGSVYRKTLSGNWQDVQRSDRWRFDIEIFMMDGPVKRLYSDFGDLLEMPNGTVVRDRHDEPWIRESDGWAPLPGGTKTWASERLVGRFGPVYVVENYGG